jgi:hypothetical protein
VKNKEELWITNINRFQDITIGDLAITLPRGVSINLLATKKNGLSLYNVTRKQIDKSFESGSLFKKGLHIKRREVAPVEIVAERVEIAKVSDVSTARTVRKPPEIEKIDFPDLETETADETKESKEAFAAETADMAMSDRAPVLAVDPIFKKKKKIDDDE